MLFCHKTIKSSHCFKEKPFVCSLITDNGNSDCLLILKQCNLRKSYNIPIDEFTLRRSVEYLFYNFPHPSRRLPQWRCGCGAEVSYGTDISTDLLKVNSPINMDPQIGNLHQR